LIRTSPRRLCGLDAGSDYPVLRADHPVTTADSALEITLDNNRLAIDMTEQ
jgi:hypothetical protein